MKRDLDDDVGAVRAFNRFYTGRIGALSGGFLDSPFSLTEVRVLYELAHRDSGSASASELETGLGLDAGYLSRMLKRFESLSLLTRAPDPEDRRRQLLDLTETGRTLFAPLDRRQHEVVAAMLEGLAPAARTRLAEAMGVLRSLLDDKSSREAVTLRPHRPGDIGWIVETHGELYAVEYGWDARFEALVARICADFLDNLDPERERCWIAERAAERLGSVMLVKHPEQPDTAKLRLLLVAPWARGLGLGTRLVRACVDFAAAAGYRRVTLWTNDVLASARRIYEAAGFRLIASEPHHSFGHDLIGQTFELDLDQE